jgi:hypothetical protein
MNVKPVWCPCGKEITAGGSIVAVWSGKKDDYYKVECPCGHCGPVGRNKEEAILKWNYYRGFADSVK